MEQAKAPVVNQTLLQRADDQVALWGLIHASGGELSGPLESWLDEIEKNLAEKVDTYKSVLDDIDNEAERLRARAKDFSAAAKTLENTIDGIKSRMKIAMNRMGIEELRGNDYRFVLAKTQPALSIDLTQLPIEWTMQVTEVLPDKEKIKLALDMGEFVPGAELKTSYALRSYILKKGKS